MIRNISGATNSGPRSRRVRLKYRHHCMWYCMDTNKPWSYAHRTRQSSEFAPEIERTDAVLINGGAAVVHAQPGDPDLCIGRPIAFHPEITPPPLHRLYPGQPDSARPGIGGPIAFPVTIFVHGKDTSKSHEIQIGERLCCVVGYSERTLHEPKTISK